MARQPRQQYDISFAGPDIDRALRDMTQQVFGENAIKRANGIISRGMRKSATLGLEILRRSLKRRTGASAEGMFVKRIKSGGFRVAAAKREDLARAYPKALKAKGYYPAVREWEDKSMRNAFKANRQRMLDEMVSYVKGRVEKELKKYLKKQGALQ
jgi:hypothetical protein